MPTIHPPDPTPVQIRIANNIRSLCHRQQLSQRDVAAAVGLSQAMVSRWTKCTSTPDAIQAAELARLFRVPLDLFVNADVSALSLDELNQVRDIAAIVGRIGNEETHRRLLMQQTPMGRASIVAADEPPAAPARKKAR